MPVLLVDRDPVLVSIDQQRLADLGIPSEVVHDHAAGFYGPRGIMWAALVVPDGWQDALPDELPVPEEWDDEMWARAENDSSEEMPEHARPVQIGDSMMAGLVAAFFFWCPFLLTTIATVIYQGARARPALHEYLPNAIHALPPLLLTGLVGGLVAPEIGRRLSLKEGLIAIAWIVVAIYFNFPAILIQILRR